MLVQSQRFIVSRLATFAIVSAPLFGSLNYTVAAPKYQAGVLRLSEFSDPIRKRPSPDFWALIPYYLPQQDSRSCSVASVTMLMNAMRATTALTSSDSLFTQKNLLNAVKSSLWNKAVGPIGRGVTLDQLKDLVDLSLEKALKAGNTYQSEVIRFPDTEAGKKQLIELLKQNEQGSDNWIVANFLQGVLTGDPEGLVGHISPIAAFDEATGRVLILDSDREWYEPYWVSVDLLFKALNTVDGVSKKSRGLVFVRKR